MINKNKTCIYHSYLHEIKERESQKCKINNQQRERNLHTCVTPRIRNSKYEIVFDFSVPTVFSWKWYACAAANFLWAK